MKDRGHTVLLVIVSILCAILVTIVLMEEPTDDLFYIGPNTEGHGHLFLQPSSEFENVINISLSDLNDWSISGSSIEIGEKFTATFTDRTLWELESIKQD